MNNDDVTFKSAFSIITISVILLGLLGNILTVMVFSRPTFRKNSISIYCISLAIFDSHIIYDAVIYFITLLYNYLVITYSDAACIAISYITYGFNSIPTWILIAFSIDKLKSLKKLSNGMKRPIIHYMIILSIVLFNLILYIEIPIYLRLVTIDIFGVKLTLCDSTTLWFGEAINIISLIQGSVIPILILVGSSIYTIKLLRDSRRKVNLTEAAADKRRVRENKYAITSLTFNILFIVLKTPFFIVTTIGYSNFSVYVLYFMNLLFALNFSISFLVHFALNSLFRRELSILFRLRQPVVDSIMPLNLANRLSIKPSFGRD